MEYTLLPLSYTPIRLSMIDSYFKTNQDNNNSKFYKEHYDLATSLSKFQGKKLGELIEEYNENLNYNLDNFEKN